jgi:hypothetical protein
MASNQTIDRRRKPATPRPTRRPSPATAPPPDVAPDFELRREIELVVRHFRTKEIIGRTGIFVSSIESGYLTETGDTESLFELAFAPGAGVETPPGCYWSEKSGTWVASGRI